MYSKIRFGFMCFFSTLLFYSIMLNPVCAQNSKIDSYDSIRAELNCIKDKNSPSYIKTQQKLNKFISHNKIDYSAQARFNDIHRLIKEQKYNAAIYELNDLIDNGIEISTCYEILGDLSLETKKTPKKIASYYKSSIQYDPENINALIKLAKLYISENKNILGIEYFKEAIEKADNISYLNEIEEILKNKIVPQNKYEANNSYEALGLLYQKANRIEESFHAFNKALRLNPKDIFIKYYLGNLLYEYNDTTNANLIFNSILQEYPQDTQIRISKAKLMFKNGNLLSANKEFLTILENYPNSNSAKYGIYKIFENKLPPEEIIKKIYANESNYKVTKESSLEFAKFLEEMGEMDASLNFKRLAQNIEENQKKKIAQHFDNEIINKKVAQEVKKETAKPQTSSKELTKELTSAKTTKKPQINTKKQIKNKKVKQAKEIKEKKVVQEVKKEKQTNQIEQNKENEKKLKEYENKVIAQEKQKAIAKDPIKYKEYQSTIEKYENITPKTAQIYTAIANTYKQMGQPTSALINYKEAQKLDPTNSDIYYNLGLAYMELNSLESAKTNLTKAINLDSENTKANNLLAFVNHKIITQIINKAHDDFEKKNYVEAFEILDDGIKKYPNNAQMYYYRALVCDSMNRNAAQIIDLHKAIELDPSYYMAYYQLGSAYEKINDERSALIAYEKFLSIEPDEKELIDEIQKKVIALGAKYY